uniref:RUNX1 partner transcriptional co-repressor 1 n=1 Tax=Cyclopterus lumpus TaxID=8103 RepID=A0A8C2WLR5_CYCLU
IHQHVICWYYNLSLCPSSDRTGKRSTMPDSPADVKTQSRLTPPTMPPPPSTQGAPRNSSYTPTTLTNGSSHSPTALNGAPSPPNKNGFERDGALHPDVHPSKRPCTISPAQRFSPSNGLSYQPNGLPHPGPLPPQHYRLDDMAIAHHYRDNYRHPPTNHREIRERARPIGMHTGTRQEEVIDHRLTDREWAEEWKHLDHLLNCIMDMVEKTRRSLTVLRRCQEADREELNYWIRRYSDAEELKKGAAGGQSRQQSPAAQDNATPGRGSHTHAHVIESY